MKGSISIQIQFIIASGAILVACFALSPDEIRDKLSAGVAQINNSTPPFCYTGHSGTRSAMARKSYQDNFGDLTSTTLVYPFCLTTRELGNQFGNYIVEMSCADVVGLNFVTVHPQWDMTGSHHGNGSHHLDTNSRLAFLKALPSLRVHPSPVETSAASQKAHEECKCTRYCWQDPLNPWVRNIPNIRTVLRTAITAYYEEFKKNAPGNSPVTHVDPVTDFSNAKPGDHLPIIPDVALQYRCGDNLGFSYMYGILPFFAFDSRIPQGSKYIYVLSDHPSRAPHSPFSARCHTVLNALFEYLKVRNPTSTIVVKRGGDLFLDYVRLAFANTTICSASSYCLWPALANTGTSYFPLTSVVAGADSVSLAPKLASNFHWIVDPPIISDFRKYRPWNAVIDVLTGEKPLPR